jgi:hypothetical protein
MSKSRYILDLKKALENVDWSYVQYSAIKSFGKGDKIKDCSFFDPLIEEGYVDEAILEYLEGFKDKKEHSLERNFCYQLYFEWQTIIKAVKKQTYNGLVLNGEITKDNLARAIKESENIRNTELFNAVIRIGLIEKEYFSPDFTLHGGQHDIDNQRLIAEVKYGHDLGGDKFKTDFLKLALYQKLFHFSECVFIIVNLEEDMLLKHLRKVDFSLVDGKSFWIMLKTQDAVINRNLEEWGQLSKTIKP